MSLTEADLMVDRRRLKRQISSWRVAAILLAVAVIVTLILLGRMLESRAKGRTSQAIKRLVGLQAKTARVFWCGPAPP